MTENNILEQKPLRQDRPDMPGYGIDRAQTEKMLTWEWVSEQMLNSRNYWICSTKPDGKPHAVPVWGVWLNEKLYFGTGRNSRKAKNLALNPEVVVHLESGDKTVIFEGVLEEVTDLAEYQALLKPLNAKYKMEFPLDPDPNNITYILKPRLVMAWLEMDFLNTATRFHFDNI
jgi:nitroimidazol reductase NimA-like FMN-containing flavoprotein (pyridoxamine 5'-phosphate oxidase superfamily)